MVVIIFVPTAMLSMAAAMCNFAATEHIVITRYAKVKTPTSFRPKSLGNSVGLVNEKA